MMGTDGPFTLQGQKKSPRTRDVFRVEIYLSPFILYFPRPYHIQTTNSGIMDTNRACISDLVFSIIQSSSFQSSKDLSPQSIKS